MTHEELAVLLDARRAELHALPRVLSVGLAERDGTPCVELLVGEGADVDLVAAAAAALLPGAPVVLERCGPVDAGA